MLMLLELILGSFQRLWDPLGAFGDVEISFKSILVVLLLGGLALEPSQWLWSWFEGHLNGSGFGLEAILMPLGPSQWLWAHLSCFGVGLEAISMALGPSQSL